MTPTFFLLLTIGSIGLILLTLIYVQTIRSKKILDGYLYIIAKTLITSENRSLKKDQAELDEEKKQILAEIEELKEQLRKKYEGGN